MLTNNDAEYIKTQLGLVPENQFTVASGTGKEYAFAWFLLRYRVRDVFIWLENGCPPVETNAPRDTLPETDRLVSSELLVAVAEAYAYFIVVWIPSPGRLACVHPGGF